MGLAVGSARITWLRTREELCIDISSRQITVASHCLTPPSPLGWLQLDLPAARNSVDELLRNSRDTIW